ncbi:hypothetical protein C6P82_28160 [Burkholderia multivorans]|nr:hypothetical protein C6P82_28160 [Burkholderia multivorans]
MARPFPARSAGVAGAEDQASEDAACRERSRGRVATICLHCVCRVRDDAAVSASVVSPAEAFALIRSCRVFCSNTDRGRDFPSAIDRDRTSKRQ